MKISSPLKFSLAIVIALALGLSLTGTISANSPSLDNMIEIRDDDNNYDAAEAQAMIDRLDRVDERILSQTDRAGVKIILMDMPLTELPEFEYLSGVVPRGWEGTGRTWDEVPGAGGFTTAARIGYSEPGNGHSTINLEIHEYAHAVDSYAAGFTVSESDEFRQIMAGEKDNLFHDHQVPDYFDYPGEYFAETFAMYYLGGEQQAKLAQRAPETYRFMDTFHNRLISIGEVTGNTAAFSWDALEGAETYEIYRNNERIDTTADTGYTDTGLDTATNYNYYIQALDSQGNTLLTTYFRSTTTYAESDPPVTDHSELDSVIGEVEALAEEERTPELQSALEHANTVSSDQAATQEQVDEAASALSTALDNNEIEEETVEEPAEESTEEVTEEPVEESTEEETVEESAEEEPAGEEIETEQDSAQVEADESGSVILFGVIVFLGLAIVTAFIIWMRRK